MQTTERYPGELTYLRNAVSEYAQSIARMAALIGPRAHIVLSGQTWAHDEREDDTLPA
jgi:hypothetical protein